MKTLLLLGAAVMLMAGCAADAENAGDPSADVQGEAEDEVISADPLAMPKPMLTFLRTQDWGSHHLEWHTVRQWDRLSAEDQAYAKRQGWARADLMEGAKGNGLEFLAMHRVMIRKLTEKFPGSADLFAGWTQPPTENKDKNDPATDTARFDANKAAAIDKLQNHLADFKSDDELGLYIESTLRPTASDPNARAADKSTGLHNYLHYRFQDQSSKIDLGDPSVNLQNKRFWRLHGWIESRWTAFRTLKHLSEDDPKYRAALEKGEDMFVVKPRGPIGKGPPEAPPESLRKFFTKDL
ncbi:MAG: hypothetical protein JWP87_262 [Labilithrix sp.]|nr:hypothetical protein [Labilithrix sp.]